VLGVDHRSRGAGGDQPGAGQLAQCPPCRAAADLFLDRTDQVVLGEDLVAVSGVDERGEKAAGVVDTVARVAEHGFRPAAVRVAR
jgi:hypothetical protein